MEGDPEMESLLAQRQALLDQMKAQGLEPASKKDGPSRGTSWHSSQTGSQQQFPSLPPPDTPSEQTSPVRQTFPDTVQDSAPETQQPQSQTGQPVQIKKPEESQASQSQSLESKKPAESQASQSQSFESKKPAESQAAQSQSLESKKPAESQAAQSQSLVPSETKTREQATTGQDQQAKAKAQPKRLLPSSKAKPGQTKEDDEYCLGEEDQAIAPPAQVSKATLMKRLARLCTPREDGSCKIPQDVINTYKNIETREQVYRSFEKCGCDPVLFSKRINRKYEEINEKSVETEFEFLTEQEMEEKGWSEKKIKGAKRSCEKRPGWKRKSEYCDEWMYWVAVRVKGSNKKTKRHTVAEILEGEDQGDGQDPEEAMKEFPHEGEDENAAAGGDDESDEDSSDNGEEASRILKKVMFPEVGKRPQEVLLLVTACLQKRSSKLVPVLQKLESMEKNMPLSSSQVKYKESLKTILEKLTELEDELTTIYSNGVAVGFTKEDQKKMRAQFQIAKTRAVEAEMIFERSKNIKMPANAASTPKTEPKVKAKPKQAAAKGKAAPKRKGDDDDEEDEQKPPKRGKK